MVPKPLWARALSEPSARKFLKKHRTEFPEASFVPDDTAFSDSFLPGNKLVFEIVSAGQPYSKPDRQALAELWLQNLPIAEICRRLGWSRRKGYNKLKLLKLHAMTKWRHRRRDLVGGREEAPLLETLPSIAAYRTQTFTLHERSQTVYLIMRGDDPHWVDADGRRFPDEIQEVLHNLDELSPTFEALDVE